MKAKITRGRHFQDEWMSILRHQICKLLVSPLVLTILPLMNGCSSPTAPSPYVDKDYDEIMEPRWKTLERRRDAERKAEENDLKSKFDAYFKGEGSVPENKAKAESYLREATEKGHEWAMLVSAYWAEETNPQEAISLYLELACKNNWHAQSRLGLIYFEGELVPQNLCKAYFWALLARVGGYGRWSPVHPLFPSSYGQVWRSTSPPGPSIARMQSVPSVRFREASGQSSEYHLGPEHIQLVQNAAVNWQKGQPEPDLPLVQSEREEEPSPAKILPPDSIEISKLEARKKEIHLQWKPCDIDLNTRHESHLTSPEVFELVNPSVWTVISASTIENLKGMNNASIGSAVAVSKNELLTNYHVVHEKPYVLIKQGEQIVVAVIHAADKQSDKCILTIEDTELKPVNGFRKHEQLSVGEDVYSIGSPQGLENSLGHGLISGMRKLDEQRIIQTTAPISSGSSGGGLFDSSGNLVGITTFKLIDGEGLNFAIPIEDFTR